MTEPPDGLGRAEFFQRVAAIAFAAWAAVVGYVGVVVRDSVAVAVQENKTSREAFAEYVRVMERRVTIIEERQAVVLRALGEVDHRLDRLEGREPQGSRR